ncbi:MAG: hypothetical protein ACRCVN_03165 [Spirochaetia bacterium]
MVVKHRLFSQPTVGYFNTGIYQESMIKILIYSQLLIINIVKGILFFDEKIMVRNFIFILCFSLKIISPFSLFASATILTDVHIDRFIKVIPQISEIVMQAWNQTVIDSCQDFDQLSQEYAKNDSLIKALAQKSLSQSMAPDIFTVMLGIIVLSYQAQRHLLEKEIGQSVSDQQILDFLKNDGSLTAVDLQEIQRTLHFLDLAQAWLGQSNVSLLNRRIVELSSIITEFEGGHLS